MSFSNKSPINSQNYYTKKYQKSKKIKLKEGPISVKASQMSNMIGFDNKVKGNIISLSYFNSKLKNYKAKKNVDDKLKSENHTNYYSLLLENKINNSNSENKSKIISYNNSCYYLKSSQNPLIININNNNSRAKNERNKNLLSEVLQKYSNFTYKAGNKNSKNKNIPIRKKNNSLTNIKANNFSHTKKNSVLSTENIFNNSSSVSYIKKRKKNTVIKIDQNNNSRNISLKTNYSYLNTNITGKEEKNQKSYVDRVKMKIRNKNENIKLILLSRNNQHSNNNKILKRINKQKNELNLKYNKTSFFNNSISEIRKNSKTNILNIGNTKMKTKYIITPKNFKKDSEINTKEDEKIENKYIQYYKKKQAFKRKPIYNFHIKQISNINNCSKENINNIIIQKNNTTINNNKNFLNKKNSKNSINIIDIFRLKKPSSKIIKKNKSKVCFNVLYKNHNINSNLNNQKDIPKKRINRKSPNLKEIKDNKIQNKLFNENNLLNSSFDDNFDDLYSIIKKLKFSSNPNKSESIFSLENQEYKNYTKKFNSLYNNFYSKCLIKTKQRNKKLKRSNSKNFTESTKMKTTSHSKKKSTINIGKIHRISEFKLD